MIDEYFFSNLYNGVEGQKFRKKLQDIMIKRTLDFIDNHENEKKFPNVKDQLEEIGIFNERSLVLYGGGNGYIGIFDSLSDYIRQTLEYIETNITEESEKNKYLEAIYTSSYYIKDEDILERCRKNILDRITNNESLSDEYFFSNLYRGEKGEEFRKKLQDIMLKNTITFINDYGNEAFPSGSALLKQIGTFRYANYVLYGTKRSIGIFDSFLVRIRMTLEYIETLYSTGSEGISEQKREYLNLIFDYKAFRTVVARIEKEDKLEVTRLAKLILGSRDMQQIFIEYNGKEALDTMRKFIPPCPAFFSQDNPS